MTSKQNPHKLLRYPEVLKSSSETYAPTGWYAPGAKTQYDFHDGGNTDPRGLVEETRDAFDNRSTVQYDDYKMMPVSSRQYLDATNYLETSAEYDYRILQPWMVTDPNGNRSVFGFSPLGLLMKSGVIGKTGEEQGDIITETPFAWKPSVLMEYNFLAWYEEQKPVWVKTIQNEQHYQDNNDSPTIAKVEFSDGFGRLLQTRAQAEDVIFGATEADRIFGDSGLPADQEANNANALGTERGSTDPLNVVVSGWQVYDNKGRVVEQYEPFFSQGLDDYAPVQESQKGESLTMFYDPAGRVVRTVNPDGSEQRLVVGIPPDLENPDNFAPSPWHHYAYDTNDLADFAPPGNTSVPESHKFTPKSEIVDALGRTIKTTEHEAASNNGDPETFEDVVMKYEYDIRGNLKKVTDALDRQAFAYSYDLANQPLKTTHIDSGVSDAIIDATGKPIEGNDAKDATVLNVYDNLNRPQLLWAKDHGTDSFSLRQITIYGDGPFADLTQQQAAAKNLLGQAYKIYDESGLIVANEFDFKGNLLEKLQKVLKDSLLQSTSAYTVDWPMPDDSNFDTLTSDLLEHKAHESDTTTDGYITENIFDALNRVVKITLPKDVDDNRKEILPTYNRAGALEKVTFDQSTYVNHIAYNAKGQRILLALGNGVMTRYTYDDLTFRLVRQRTETYSQDGWEYTPGGSVKQDTAYRYDLAGNIIETTENRTDAGFGTTLVGGQGPTPHELVREFEYDPLYRLILATGREDTSHSHNLIWQDTSPVSPTPANSREYRRTYQYDKMGNILKLAHTAHQAAFTRNFGYHTSMDHNKLEEVLDNNQNTLTDFLYDAAGNTIQNNSERFYTWDAANQLKHFKIDDGQTVSVYGQYLYSGGQRVKKLVKDQQGNYTITVYIDGVFEYQKLVKGANTYERNYTHIMDDRSRIATVRAGSDEDDITEDAFYIVEDHLNSSTARLKATDGSVIDREESYPFGETSLHNYSKKRYRYTGKEKDSESGLYYYGARYYSAWCCRFISVDPLAAQYAHLSSYNYASNSPVGELDVDGMQNPKEGGSEKSGNGTGNSSHSPMGGRGFLEPSGGTGELVIPTDNVSTDKTTQIEDTTESVAGYIDYFDHEGNLIHSTPANGQSSSYIISNRKESKDVQKQLDKGENVEFSSLDSLNKLPSKRGIADSLSDLQATIDAGSDQERASITFKDGTSAYGELGPKAVQEGAYVEAESDTPKLPEGYDLSDVESFNHSHITKIYYDNDGDPFMGADATYPSKTDERTVLRFSTLGGMDVLISGPLGPGTKDPHYSNRMHPPANGIAIYRGSRAPKFTISVEVAEKLIKYMRK